jgi:hypothetical protein
MTRRAATRLLPAALAFLLGGACASAPERLDPATEKIVGIQVLDAGSGTVTLPDGYRLLQSLSGDTEGGQVNMGIWNDLVPVARVFVAYRTEVTDNPVGITEVHVSSSDAAAEREIFGAAGHDAIYGASSPGCASQVDLNSGTCRSAGVTEWYSGWCAFYFWDAACAGPGTPLFLHHVTQTRPGGSIRCLVVGDEIAVDPNQPPAARRAHLWWGPADANRDGAVNEADADWVLAHVSWVKGASGTFVNLNRGTQSFARYNWYDCGLGQGYDDAWIHLPDDIADAQYLGTCPP